MFDLNGELKQWRAILLRSGVLRAEDIDELEIHLRELIETLTADGLGVDAAFRTASEQLGDIQSITNEFAKENRTMNVVSRIIGVTIVGLTVGLGAFGSGEIAWFIHFPSLISVLGIVMGGLLLSFRSSAIWKAIARSVGTGQPHSQQELDLNTMVFDRGRQLAWAGGLLAALTGFIAMMWAAGSGVKVSEIGFAVIALNLFYGVILAEVIITPLKHAMIARCVGVSFD